MTRAEALAWLKAEFTEAAADVGWTFTTTADEGRFAPAIDNALRSLGVPESGLSAYEVQQDEAYDFLLLLNYYALQLIVKVLGLRVDVQVDDPMAQAKRSQAATLYSKLLAAAKLDVKGLLKSGFEFGSVELDIYEPTELC